MRNYFFSITVHVVLLLLLLGLSFGTIKNKPELMEAVIMVDFSESTLDRQRPVPQTKASEDQRTEQKKLNPPSPPKEAVKTEVAKAVKVKTFEKEPLRTSQKPKAESSKVLEEKSSVTKETIPHLDPKATEKERAEAKREKEKEAKRSHFTDLLAKAKNNTATDQNQPETEEEDTSEKSGSSSFSTNKNRNIQGVLGNRKVLRTPTIKDESQKKGRVVVKICVGSDGQVISSKYTMMGSTTSDTYLIGLAEKGGMEYLFSPSNNPKECGNVTIDFQLK